MKKVPYILTGKDLDYLKDIFGWNYLLYKIGEDSKSYIEDKDIIKLVDECDKFFYENMNTVTSILENYDNEDTSINNDSTKVLSGVELNDKDYLTNLLTLLKDMEKNMATVLTEASNEKLYLEYKNIFDKYSELQRKVYEKMFELGWYQLEVSPMNKVSKLLKNLENDFDNLN